MKKLFLVLTFVCSLIAFVKNEDYHSITQTSFVNSIAVEYDQETNNFTMYFFVLNNYLFGQIGSNAPEGTTSAFISKASAKDLFLAEQLIRENSNIMFDLTHIRSIIIHENFFIGDNAKKLMYYFQNNFNYFPSFQIYITSDEIIKIFQIQNFSEVSAYFTILVNTQTNLPVPQVSFNSFINDLLDENLTTCYSTITTVDGLFVAENEKFISLEFDGSTFINNDLQLCSFKYDNLPGLKYFTNLNNKKMEIKYEENSFFISINKLTIKNHVKSNHLVISINLDSKVIDNYANLSNQQIKDYIRLDFTNNLNQMLDTLYNYDIDFFNIKYRYQNKYDFKSLPIKYNFTIKITT